MDQDSQGFDEKQKQELEKQLIEKLISAIEAKQIDISQMKIIANYILDNIQNIKDHSQMLLFLNILKSKWVLFTDIYNLHNVKSYEDKEKVVINKLAGYISNFKN